MRTPVPVATIYNDDEWQRAAKRIVELGRCKFGSVEEAEKLALTNAISAWLLQKRIRLR
ncbi:hypothetical protein EV560_108101 [Bosea sp. BK604]|nr:hypothetical protein EV560_108101 [Bosea sp. BK604]